MNWSAIKAKLDQVSSSGICISGLLDDEQFWASDDHLLLAAAFYLHENNQPQEGLRVIDAVKTKRLALSSEVARKFRYLRGDALLSLEKYPEAVGVYDEILAAEVSDVALANRALAFWEMGEFQNALDDYLQALSVNPLNAIAQRGAGEMLIKIGRSSEAVRYLRAAVKLDDRYAPAYAGLGTAFYHLQDWRNSCRAFRQAVALNPDDKVAMTGLAKIEAHFKTGVY